ncbi:MAG TPA: acyl-CoA dehydrogenase family protein [Pyrinomonadaceae bacterium]|nr:acyl-CoA dehydrogenase family protein [Pyrinomonadaceae bacterium]
MDLQSLKSPLAFLGELVPDSQLTPLKDYESWWFAEGVVISEAVDRAGTPWLRMFDQFGKRADEILFPPDYWKILKRGYQAGAIWRPFADDSSSLRMHYLIDYVTCFFDAGLGCPYIVSLSTTVPLKKYGAAELRDRYLPHLLRRDGTNWQGATWMTEVKGGSDLGANVETIARPVQQTVQSADRSASSDLWLLNGDKYFCSNVGAELAIVAARPAGAPHSGTGVPHMNHAQDARATPHGLALFLVPRIRGDGGLNYFIRRLKNKIGTRSVPTGEVELRDSEAYLLGKPEWGIYLILESLNLSRVGNITGSVALAQRALADALTFAEGRVAFGKPIIEHPLMRRQFDERFAQLREARALMWEAIHLLDEVWQETPRYSDRYHLFRLIAHLAKYWTAELAVQFAKWNMEVHGGLGVLAEYPAERWLREAMILPIWEGTPHRQMLDGLEVMERKRAHEMLFQHLAPYVDQSALQDISSRIEQHLQLPAEAKEAGIEPVFRDLAMFTARALAGKPLEK